MSNIKTPQTQEDEFIEIQSDTGTAFQRWTVRHLTMLQQVHSLFSFFVHFKTILKLFPSGRNNTHSSPVSVFRSWPTSCRCPLQISDCKVCYWSSSGSAWPSGRNVIQYHHIECPTYALLQYIQISQIVWA